MGLHCLSSDRLSRVDGRAHRSVRTRVLAGFVGSAWLLFAAPLAAQDPGSEWRAPRWMGDVAFVSSNALLGGLTAGVLQKLDGGDFRDGFTRGALGGAVAYAGRRVSAETFYGAGLLGRQVSAVGASVVRNAGDGRPSLERLVVPLGPARLYVDRSDGLRVQPRIALRDLVWTMTFILRSETEFDASASLSAGAPVFTSPLRSFVSGDGEEVDGVHSGGVIGLSDVSDEKRRSAFAHERVHVLQNDFALLVWSDPIERRLLDRPEWGRAVTRYVELGVAFPAVRGAVFHIFDVEHAQQPGEIEAKFLDRRRR
jgi:hypothetical protein